MFSRGGRAIGMLCMWWWYALQKLFYIAKWALTGQVPQLVGNTQLKHAAYISTLTLKKMELNVQI